MHQLATHFAKMPILPMVKVTTEEKVSSMYGQCYEEEPSQVQEEYDPEVYGERVWRRSYRVLLTALETSPHYFLMAVRDCIVNKKSQAEIATKYNIPRSRVQWAMSGKKEHKKGGKQLLTGEKREKYQKKTLQEV